MLSDAGGGGGGVNECSGRPIFIIFIKKIGFWKLANLNGRYMCIIPYVVKKKTEISNRGAHFNLLLKIIISSV